MTTHRLHKLRRPPFTDRTLDADPALRELRIQDAGELPDGIARAPIAEGPPVLPDADKVPPLKHRDRVPALNEKPDRRHRHQERIDFDRVDREIARLRLKLTNSRKR